jgi:predicted aspartyl protease
MSRVAFSIALFLSAFWAGHAAQAEPPSLATCQEVCQQRPFMENCLGKCLATDMDDLGTRVSKVPPTTTASTVLVPLRLMHGVFTVPASINEYLQLDFMLDSGAGDVSIPADFLSELLRNGVVTNSDLTAPREYRLANGDIIKQQTFRIRSLKVGGILIENVDGSVSGGFLLGQTFLRRFRSWSIDNQRRVLVLVLQ